MLFYCYTSYCISLTYYQTPFTVQLLCGSNSKILRAFIAVLKCLLFRPHPFVFVSGLHSDRFNLCKTMLT